VFIRENEFRDLLNIDLFFLQNKMKLKDFGTKKKENHPKDHIDEEEI